jgi:DNA mismatch endonuclease (patch repair protein)
MIGELLDRITTEQRSALMARIRSKDTKPELVVRSLVHRLGYRFRLHRKDLPGRPDIILPRHKKIILVQGCFWHGHIGCNIASKPKSNQAYWVSKLEGNRARDQRNLCALKELGWEVFELWECEIADEKSVVKKISKFLRSNRKRKKD